MIIEFSENWSAFIRELAEKRGIKPENLILDALVTYNFLSQELDSEKGGRALALLEKDQKPLEEIIIPGHSSQFTDMASLTIRSPLPFGVTVEDVKCPEE